MLYVLQFYQMTIFHALILGIVEGITEFLPVSSTAHLIITSKFLEIPQNQFNSFFEVFIQSGAILAVVVLYWKLFINRKSLIINLFISFIPTAIVGFIFYPIIKTYLFNSMTIIIGSLFTVGILFMVLELYISKINRSGWKWLHNSLKLCKSVGQMGYYDAFIIGLVQATAIIPGVSRAGAVIIAMLLLRYKRKDAAIYSFLLAVPTILTASLFDLIKTDITSFSLNNYLLIIIGFLTSFITAYIVIKWFINYLQKNTLVSFGVYRIILAVLLTIFI